MPDPATMSDEQLTVYQRIISGKRGKIIGPYWAALHQPVLADTWQQLGKTLRFDTVFPPIYSELAILLTARRWNSELEWVVHREEAEKAGLSAEICDAILEHRIPEFEDNRAQVIYDYVTQMQNTGQVSADVHAQITEHWGVVGVVELTALIGFYVMVSMTLNAHQIPLPEGRQAELYPEGAEPATALSELP